MCFCFSLSRANDFLLGLLVDPFIFSFLVPSSSAAPHTPSYVSSNHWTSESVLLTPVHSSNTFVHASLTFLWLFSMHVCDVFHAYSWIISFHSGGLAVFWLSWSSSSSSSLSSSLSLLTIVVFLFLDLYLMMRIMLLYWCSLLAFVS